VSPPLPRRPQGLDLTFSTFAAHPKHANRNIDAISPTITIKSPRITSNLKSPHLTAASPFSAIFLRIGDSKTSFSASVSVIKAPMLAPAHAAVDLVDPVRVDDGGDGTTLPRPPSEYYDELEAHPGVEHERKRVAPPLLTRNALRIIPLPPTSPFFPPPVDLSSLSSLAPVSSVSLEHKDLVPVDGFENHPKGLGLFEYRDVTPLSPLWDDKVDGDKHPFMTGLFAKFCISLREGGFNPFYSSSSGDASGGDIHKLSDWDSYSN